MGKEVAKERGKDGRARDEWMEKEKGNAGARTDGTADEEHADGSGLTLLWLLFLLGGLGLWLLDFFCDLRHVLYVKSRWGVVGKGEKNARNECKMDRR